MRQGRGVAGLGGGNSLRRNMYNCSITIVEEVQRVQVVGVMSAVR
ncbi:hypothetical protein RR48_01881 [Papilio machaon]|uniref:Uncharacterized protein n=1 Tax=Papilio machaon TaxID=76193 RepID=A0A0N1IHC5_PAPMA|nr:hypothetical protein RR48_01881 [Papilio machaon]